METTMTIKLTAAQVSALECSGLDMLDGDYPVLAKTWNGRTVIKFTEADRDALYTEVNDRSNAEDAAAEHDTDEAMARQARGASVALGNLGSKILRVGR